MARCTIDVAITQEELSNANKKLAWNETDFLLVSWQELVWALAGIGGHWPGILGALVGIGPIFDGYHLNFP